MATCADKSAALLLLLSLAGNASAQAVPPERPVAELLRPYDVKEWPQAPGEGTQTAFRIRHNAADGTVVGMSLQQSQYPSFLLQLELVPPGQETFATTRREAPPPTDPPGNETFRRIHKLSLRYRF